MSVIAFIPARGGSKSVPGKNIRQFLGRPLLWYACAACAKCPEVVRTVVSTDSDEIASAARSFGLPGVSADMRDPALARDESPTMDCVMEWLRRSGMRSDDVLVLVQCTCPFVTPADISDGVRRLLDHGFDSVVSAVRVKPSLLNGDGTPALDWGGAKRRQDYEGLWELNGGLWLSRAGDVLKSGSMTPGRVGILPMPEYSLADIDSEDDLAVAELLWSRHRDELQNE